MLFLVVLCFGEANLQLSTIYCSRRLVEYIAWLFHCREGLAGDGVGVLLNSLAQLRGCVIGWLRLAWRCRGGWLASAGELSPNCEA